MTPQANPSAGHEAPENQSENPKNPGGGRLLVLLMGGLVLVLVIGYFWATSTRRSSPVGTPGTALTGLAAAPVGVAQEPVVGPEAAGEAAPVAALAATTLPAAAAPKAAPAVAVVPVPVSSTAPAPAVAAAEPAAPEPAPATPAANQTLTGRITDENGKPLIGATVFLRGAGRGTSTDADGNYTLEVPAGDNKLMFGYGGYIDEEVETAGGKSVNVALTPDPNSGKKRKR